MNSLEPSVYFTLTMHFRSDKPPFNCLIILVACGHHVGPCSPTVYHCTNIYSRDTTVYMVEAQKVTLRNYFQKEVLAVILEICRFLVYFLSRLIQVKCQHTNLLNIKIVRHIWGHMILRFIGLAGPLLCHIFTKPSNILGFMKLTWD